MVNVLLITRSLGNGGAEQQLFELLRAIDKRRIDMNVATFYPGGVRWADVSSIGGIRLSCLEKKGRWDFFNVLRNALRAYGNTRIDVIYGYREEGNLLAFLLAKILKTRLVWGIRSSNKALPEGLFARCILWVGALISRGADCIIYNSVCGRDSYVARGYTSKNATVIPNGFDTNHFYSDPIARKIQRADWGILEHEIAIGIVARIVPVKNHRFFLCAAALVAKKYPHLKFMVVGGGQENYIQELRDYSRQLGIEERVVWAGESREMAKVYNALDLMALCSHHEGCPNVVGEAMACGTPCVVTDVGDAALMVGNPDFVVKPGDVENMAAAWARFLDLPRETCLNIGDAMRDRIKRGYSLESMAERTTALLEGNAALSEGDPLS